MCRSHATLLLLLLAAACVAGVLRVAAIERPGSPIGVPRVEAVGTPAQRGVATFSPNGDGRFDEVQLTLKLRRAGAVTVDVVDEAGRRVRRLADDRQQQRGEVRLSWDGALDDASRAREGVYSTRVAFEGRRFRVQTPMRIDLTPPADLRLTADLSRLATLHTVRLYLQSDGALEREVRLRGQPLNIVPYSLRRSKTDLRKRTYTRVRLAVRVPPGTTRSELTGSLVAALRDVAGNEATGVVTVAPDGTDPPFEVVERGGRAQ